MSIIFELVTPEKLSYSSPVDMVIIPGAEGEFGVMEGHVPMIAMVTSGVVDIYIADSIKERFFIAGGFAEVTNDRCTMLAEESYKLSEVTRDMALEKFDQASKMLERARTDSQKKVAEKFLESSQALLNILQ